LSEYNRNNHHYCSNNCQIEYRHKAAYEDRSCEICGKIMNVSKISKQRFCSDECQNKWQESCVGHNNPRYNRLEVKCSYCGNVIEVHPCDIKNKKHQFCNTKCRRNWYSEVFSQSEEWKEKSRIRGTSILSSGAIPSSLTSIQLKINSILNDNKISFTNEYNCKYFAIDNFLNESNLMIEVMGDYWHTNPNQYKIIKYKHQAKTISRDKAKRTYINNNYGINILSLWECDINNDVELCTKIIQEYIGSGGLLQNYNSFNYSLKDNRIVLNTDIIYPYFEVDIDEYRNKIEIA